MTSNAKSNKSGELFALKAPLLAAGLICSAIGNASAAPLVFTTQGLPIGEPKLGLPPGSPPGQVAPVQLNSFGNPFTPSGPPPGRRFDFRGLTTPGSTGLFTGVSGIQWTGTSSEGVLRSDYLAPLAGTCSSSDISAGGTCDWSGMQFTLRPFYFTGDASCVICGVSNTVSLVNLTGSGKRTVSSSSTPVQITDTLETLFATITFGTGPNAPQARVRYMAANSYPSGGSAGPNFTSNGVITFEEAVPVPGPLPILGGSVAFGFSRRLRQRLRLTKKSD
jgi:hypothetical protein